MGYCGCERTGYVLIREDSDLFVFAERPADIRPQELSAELKERFSIDHFRFSLQRNVYVIYVDRPADSLWPDDYGCPAVVDHGDNDRDQGESVSTIASPPLPSVGKAAASTHHLHSQQHSGRGIRSAKLQGYKRRSEDIKLAKRALRIR